MNLIRIPALIDNYIWLLHNDNNECIVIDPGEAVPVIKIITKHNLIPVAILLTHNHNDHTKGVIELKQRYLLQVYGPEEVKDKGVTKIIKEGDTITLLNRIFIVISLPGHTLGHVGFYSSPWLFSGDTIFSAGCGRLFEGSYKQMHTSLQKINQLPLNTIICAAHEYTLNNLNFAVSILPKSKIIKYYQNKIKNLRLKNRPSLPTILYIERQINVFLQCYNTDLQNKLNIYPISGEEWRVFSILRNKKDNF